MLKIGNLTRRFLSRRNHRTETKVARASIITMVVEVRSITTRDLTRPSKIMTTLIKEFINNPLRVSSEKNL